MLSQKQRQDIRNKIHNDYTEKACTMRELLDRASEVDAELESIRRQVRQNADYFDAFVTSVKGEK